MISLYAPVTGHVVVRYTNASFTFSSWTGRKTTGKWRSRDLEHLRTLEHDERCGLYLARLLAYLAADGSVTVNRKRNKERGHSDIRFYLDDLVLVDLFTETVSYLYRRTPTVRKAIGHYSTYLSSQVACAHLSQFGRFGSLEWRVPHSILTTRERKREWLRAFFDCEGYVGKNCIRVESVNERGLDDVQRLLGDFSIPCRRYTYTRKTVSWSLNHILNIGTLKGRGRVERVRNRP